MRRYVLLVDANVERSRACLETIRPFGVDVQVVDDAMEALCVVGTQGPPTLLVVDLQSAPGDGFGLIEAVSQATDGQGEVIAWCPSRAVREFAAQRFSQRPVRLFASDGPTRVMKAAIERALRAPRGGARGPRCDDEVVAGLLADAQRLCGASGAAVYVRTPGDLRFRSSVAWAMNAPAPDVVDSLPHIFHMMLERSEPLFWSDHGAWALSGGLAPMSPTEVQTLAAVPIICEGQTIGVVCVFDNRPLAMAGGTLAAFKSLGHITLPDAPDAEPDAVAIVSAPVNDETKPEATPPAPPAPLDRASADSMIARELARARRAGEPLSVVLFALDVVQASRTAESASDAVAAVYDVLASAVRDSDLAIRWSPAEFLLVLNGLTAAEARPVAERIRAVTHTTERHAVAVSGGVVELGAAESAESIIARAAEKVQLARARGHNRVA